MLNHINPFKYQDKIEAVRHEIEVRKAKGEVPELLVPVQKYNFDDIIDFSVVVLSFFQMLGAIISVVFVALFVGNFSDKMTEPAGIVFVLLLLISLVMIIWGAVKVFFNRRKGIPILLAGLFTNGFIITVFAGFFEIYLYRIAFNQEIDTPTFLDGGIYFPFISMIFLIIVYNIYRQRAAEEIDR